MPMMGIGGLTLGYIHLTVHRRLAVNQTKNCLELSIKGNLLKNVDGKLHKQCIQCRIEQFYYTSQFGVSSVEVH